MFSKLLDEGKKMVLSISRRARRREQRGENRERQRGERRKKRERAKKRTKMNYLRLKVHKAFQ